MPGEPVPSLEALWHVAEKEQEFGGLSKNSDLRDYNLLEQWSNKKVIMTGSFLIFSRLIINAYLSASHLNHKLSELCKTPAPFFCHRSSSNSSNSSQSHHLFNPLPLSLVIIICSPSLPPKSITQNVNIAQLLINAFHPHKLHWTLEERTKVF